MEKNILKNSKITLKKSREISFQSKGRYSKKNLLIFCILICSCCILLFFANQILTQNVYEVPQPKSILQYNVLGYRENFKLNTSGCIIEHIPIWSKEALKYFKKFSPLNCSKGNLLKNMTLLRDERLIITKENKLKLLSINASCRYRSLKRRFGNENKPIVSSWNNITMNETDEITVKDEFIQVHCFKGNDIKSLIYENFHVQAIKKKALVKKKRVSDNDKRFNVFVISIDSISANSLIRNMPKVVDYVKKKLSAIEMKGFLKIDGPTLRNFIGMLTGYPFDKVKHFSTTKYLDQLDLIWKDFAMNGYLRFFGEDRPSIGTFNYMVKGFNKQPIEYWSKPFELLAESKRFRKKSVTDACYGETSSIQAIHNYLFDIIRVNNDTPIWAHIHQTHHVHSDFNGLSTVRNEYYEFFKSINDKGLHKNSLIFFLSDHGIRYGNFRQSYVGRLEQHMPFLYVIPPTKLIKEYPQFIQALEKNSERLTTLYDVYQTMHHLLNIDKNFTKAKGNGQSLFKSISSDRNCDTAPLKSVECLCMINKKIDKHSKIVKAGAEFAVEEMNSRIKKFKKGNDCKILSLALIVDAIQLSKKEQKITKILLTIVVKPSKGMFEVLIGYTQDTKIYTLLSDFDRINEYGEESLCVNDREIKSICYCNK